jgi:hypothetical protein
MSPKRRQSPKKRSVHKRRKPISIALNHEASLIRGSKNGPIEGGEELTEQELIGGDNFDIDGGATIQFPKPKSWSWTQFNTTVRQAVENLLYWKPEFKPYFEQGFVIGAFKANASLIFSERNVIELILPRVDHYAKKLIVCFVISKGSDSTKYYSASAYEVAIKAPGYYHNINKPNEVLSYFRSKNLA